MVLGIGSGSTIVYAVERIGKGYYTLFSCGGGGARVRMPRDIRMVLGIGSGSTIVYAFERIGMGYYTLFSCRGGRTLHFILWGGVWITWYWVLCTQSSR